MNLKNKEIWRGQGFILSHPAFPHVDFYDGGHLVLKPNIEVEFFHQMDKEHLQNLSFVLAKIEKAYLKAFEKNNIPLHCLNIQDNGNWPLLRNEKRKFHLHLYGRAFDSKYQTVGQALNFPGEKSDFYKNFRFINEKVINDILKDLK